MSRTDRPGPDPLDGGNPILDFRRRFALWNNLSFWRQWAVGASLAAVAFLAVIVLDAPSAPGYVAVLRSAEDNPAWLVSADTAEGVLSVRPIGAWGAARQSFELWAIPLGSAPQPLGAVRAAGETDIPLDVELVRKIADAATLAIGPAGQPPTETAGRRSYRGNLLPLHR